MSRLDAIAQELGISRDGAKTFTSAVRERLGTAPSYAQILYAIRHCRTQAPRSRRPSAGQVATALQAFLKETSPGRSAKESRPASDSRRAGGGSVQGQGRKRTRRDSRQRERRRQRH